MIGYGVLELLVAYVWGVLLGGIVAYVGLRWYYGRGL